MSKEAIEHYEAALKEAFPSGATGNVFHHWNEARKALPEQPAQHKHISYVCPQCYWSLEEQPAQQEPVAWLRKSDLVELRACNYMRLGADSPSIWAPNAPDEPSPDMELVAVYTSPPAQRKPLTLGQKQRLWSSVGDKPTLKDRVNAYGTAIEAAHSITKGNT